MLKLFSKWLQKKASSSKNSRKKRSKPWAFFTQPVIEILEDRTTPAVFTYNGTNALFINLNNNSENLLITSQGDGNYIFNSSNNFNNFTGTDIPGLSGNGTTTLTITNALALTSINFNNQSGISETGLLFGTSLGAYADNITIGLDNAGRSFVTIGGATAFSGNAGLYVVDVRNINVNAALSTKNGDIFLDADKGFPQVGNFIGVDISANVTTTGSGSITIKGNAGKTLGENQYGVRINNAANVQTSGTGSIQINGIGNTSGNNNHGVFVEDSAAIVTEGGGNISIEGIVFPTTIDNSYSQGLVLNNAIVSSSNMGFINLSGNSPFDDGVVVNDSKIYSAGGDINIDGSGGLDDDDFEVRNSNIGSPGVDANISIDSSYGYSFSTNLYTGKGNFSLITQNDNSFGKFTLESTGTLSVQPESAFQFSLNKFFNSISLNPTSGGINSLAGLVIGKSTNVSAVQLDQAIAVGGPVSVFSGGGITVSKALSANGDILFDAETGSQVSGNFIGVNITADVTTTNNGNITIEGRGGNDVSGNQGGIKIAGGAVVQPNGSGIVVITGIGGASSGDGNDGVFLTGTGTKVSSNGGSIVVSGKGGGTEGSGINSGIAVLDGALIQSGGTGPVSVTGTGGGGAAAASFNDGIFVADKGQINSQGTLEVIGNKGTGDFTSGVNLGFFGIGTLSTNNAALNITTDNLFLGNVSTQEGFITAGTGTVSLRNKTVGTAIHLGGSGAGISLTDAQLDRITAGAIIAGRADAGVETGAITIGADLTLAPNLQLIGPNGITLKNNVTTTGSQTYTGAITLGGNTLLTAGGDLNFSSTVNGAFALTTSSVGVTTATGNIGGSTPLTSLIISKSAGANFAGAVATTVSVVIQDTVVSKVVAFQGALTTPTLAVNSGTAAYDVALNGSGTSITNSVQFKNTGSITLGNQAEDILLLQGGLTSTATSNTFLAGSIRTSGNPMTLDGVKLTANSVLDTTNNGANTGGAVINLIGGADLNGFNLVLNSGTTANTLTGTVALTGGELISKSDLSIGTADTPATVTIIENTVIQSQGAVIVGDGSKIDGGTNVLTFKADTLFFQSGPNSISAGQVILVPNTANHPIILGVPTGLGLDVTQAAFDALKTALVTIGGEGYQGNVQVHTLNLGNSIEIIANGPGGNVTFTGTFRSTRGFSGFTDYSLKITGSGTTTVLNADIIVDTDVIIDDAVQVNAAAVTINTSSGNAKVTITGGTGGIFATKDKSNSLTINAGTGAIDLGSTAGFGDNGGKASLLNNVTLSGGSTTLNASANKVQGDFTLSAGTLSLGATGAINTGGDILITSAGKIALTGNTDLVAGSDIQLGGPIEGNFDLHLAADTGDILVSGTVGATTALKTVSITDANNATFSGEIKAERLTQSSGTGATTINGAVTASASTGDAISITTRNIAIAGALSTADGNIVLDADNDVQQTGNFVGVNIAQNVTTVGNGNITIKGRGGDTGQGQRGVFISGGAKVQPGGSGKVSVTGIGGASSGPFNDGVIISAPDSAITSSGGNVTVTGTGGGTNTSSSNLGVFVNSGGEISAGDTGSVTVNGMGGAGSGGNNSGVRVVSGGAAITSFGGDLTVNGTGGSGTGGGNSGVHVSGSGVIAGGGTGIVKVSGTGGASSGNGNFGVFVPGTGSIASSGGDVTVTGTGGGLEASNTNDGIRIEGAGLISSPAVLSLNGTAGVNASLGLNLTSGTLSTAANNTALTITTDTLDINTTNGTIDAGTGTVTLQNRTNGTTINFGTASTTFFGLSQAQLDRITAETLVVGREDADASGMITVSSALTITPNLTLVSPKGITVNATLEGKGNLTLDADNGVQQTGNFAGVEIIGAGVGVTTTGNGNITISGRGGNNAVGLQGGVRVFSSVISAGGSGNISITGIGGASSGLLNSGVTLFGSGSAVTSTSGNVTINGTGGGSDASSSSYGINLSEGLISAGGTGTVSVTGTGGKGTGNNNFGVWVLNNKSAINSSGGDVTVEGKGGGSGASQSNYGVRVSDAGTISGGGNGTVSVTGTGGAGSGSRNYGVLVGGSGSTITSSGGNVIVKGTGGGSGAGTLNHGIIFDDFGTISSLGALTLTATGGANASLGLNMTTVNSGTISTATNKTALSINTDTLDITTGTITAGTGTVTLQTLTKGLAIDLGTASTTTFGLSNDQLSRITAGTLVVGSNEAVIVEEALPNIVSAALTLTPNLILNGPYGIALDNSVTTTGSQTYTGAVTLGNDISLTTTNSSIEFTSIVDGVKNLTLDAGTGDITFTGAVGSGTPLADILIQSAVNVTLSSTVAANRLTQSGGTGATTVNGAVTASASTGDAISITTRNIAITADLTTTTGDIFLNADNGTQQSGNFVGVSIIGLGVDVTTTGGNITIAGRGGDDKTGIQHGVSINARAKVQSGGTGTVLVSGTGGASSGNFNSGVTVRSTASTITSSGGDVTVTGIGGGFEGSGSNDGVYVDTAGTISAGSIGSVLVSGTGGLGSGNSNSGVVVSGAGSITSLGGNVSIMGAGGGSGPSTTQNDGIEIQTLGTISSTGVGTLALSGTKGTSSGLGVNHSGTLTTANTNISINAQTIDITNSGVINAGSGNIRFNPFEIDMDLGTASTTSFGLSNEQLNRITADTLFVGREQIGTITVSAPINLLTISNLQINSGTGITLAAGVTTSGSQTYTGAVTLGNDISLTTTNSSIEFTSIVDGVKNLTLDAGTGDITFTGAVGSGTPLADILIQSAANVTLSSTVAANRLTQTAGTGATTVNGTVTASTSTGDAISITTRNIAIAADLSATTGDIVLDADNGTQQSGNFVGVSIIGEGVAVTTTGGNITIAGRGGNDAGGDQDGILFSSALIQAGNTGELFGSININGIAGQAAGPGSTGVQIGSGSISATGGPISISGSGSLLGTSFFGNNFGVAIFGAKISNIGVNGIISLNGTGGGVAGTNFNSGVLVSNAEGPLPSLIQSIGLGISVTGTPGEGEGSSGIQIQMGSIASTDGAPISLASDSINIQNNGSITTTGTVTLQTLTKGTAIDLGTASTTTFGLSQAQLDRITAGTLVVGRKDAGFESGLITVSANLTLIPSLQLIGPNGVSLNGNVTSNGLTLNSNQSLNMQLPSATPGTGYKQFVTTGTVALTNSKLNLTIPSSFIPANGTEFILIANDGADPVQGAFQNLANNQLVTINSINYRFSYFGGDGNDVALRRSAPQPVVVGASSSSGGMVQLTLAGDSTPTTFIPFAGFFGEIRVSSEGDFSNDGIFDFVAAAGPSGGPRVTIMDGVTGAVFANFFAYNPAFTGGVYVGTGDVNGDGLPDLVTGAGAGGGPHVVVFDGATLSNPNPTVVTSFFAYDKAFTGGVTVAAGDLDGDNIAEIITGAGAGGAPQVNIYAGKTFALLNSFLAYAPQFSGGVFVAVGQLTGDLRREIITGAGPGGGSQVNVFDSQSLQILKSFFAYENGFTGGVRVGALDYNGDGIDDIVTGAGPGGGPHVKVLNFDETLLDQFFAGDANFTEGVFVS